MADNPPAFDAVAAGDLEAIRRCIAADASIVRCRDEQGATLLHRAALAGQREIVRLLVEAGADVNAQDDAFGATPAGWAIEYLRELGAVLSIEVDAAENAINRQDAEGLRWLLGHLPTVANARASGGETVREMGMASSDAAIRQLFEEA